MTEDFKQALIKMLVRHEALRLHPYLCPSGYNTIGIGHNMDANPLPDDMQVYLNENNSITYDMTIALVNADIEIALKVCHKLYHSFDYFSEGRQMALLDFVFNVGGTIAKRFFIANTCINLERWDEAAKEFVQSTWYNQTGKRSREIVAMILEEKVEAA